LVCTAFNADFDGDQMAVHIPLTKEAREEAVPVGPQEIVVVLALHALQEEELVDLLAAAARVPGT